MKPILTAVAWLCLAGGLSEACQICIPLPQKSAADFLLESDVVVLAREDPERPFYFARVAVLKGSPGEGKIDLFLDTSARRHLTLHPEHSILLVKGGDATNPGWRRIGLMDDALASIVQETLRRARIWKENPAERTAFFARRLDDASPQIRTLAHLELARAPYAEIRKYGDVLSREAIRAFLGEIRYVEWHPLYILLLAQDGRPEDVQRIRKSMESAARFGSTLNLSAWATALVEIDQEKGVQFLEKHYLTQAGRSGEELRAICAALSVHGTSESGALRDRIVGAYRDAIIHHPELTPDLIKDLLAWRRYDLSDQVAKLAMARPPIFDLTTVLRLRTYARYSDFHPPLQR
jgi:hypothetical protein